MKTVFLIAICALLLGILPVRAQDSVSLPSKTDTPASTVNVLTNAATSDLQDLKAIPPPPQLPGVPDISQLNQIFEQMKPDPAVAEHRAHVEWRKLRTRTEYDSAVLAAKADAEAAPTDLEKRNRLRVYYNLCYARMTALASDQTVVDYLKARRDEHLAMLDQPRVRPTAETEKREAAKKLAPLPAEKKKGSKKKGKHRFLENEPSQN
jgi:hypothetical protein